MTIGNGEPVSEEAREIMTVLLSLQLTPEKFPAGPEGGPYFIPTKSEEEVIDVLNEVVMILCTMLIDVANLAGVDLSASWRHAVEDYIASMDLGDDDGN